LIVLVKVEFDDVFFGKESVEIKDEDGVDDHDGCEKREDEKEICSA